MNAVQLKQVMDTLNECGMAKISKKGLGHYYALIEEQQ